MPCICPATRGVSRPTEWFSRKFSAEMNPGMFLRGLLPTSSDRRARPVSRSGGLLFAAATSAWNPELECKTCLLVGLTMPRCSLVGGWEANSCQFWLKPLPPFCFAAAGGCGLHECAAGGIWGDWQPGGRSLAEGTALCSADGGSRSRVVGYSVLPSGARVVPGSSGVWSKLESHCGEGA